MARAWLRVPKGATKDIAGFRTKPNECRMNLGRFYISERWSAYISKWDRRRRDGVSEKRLRIDTLSRNL